MTARVTLHFNGTAGIALARELADEIAKAGLDLEQWKNAVGDFKGTEFTEGCGVIVDLPDGVELRLELKP